MSDTAPTTDTTVTTAPAAPAVEPATTPGMEDRTVPYERFAEVNRQAREAREQLDTLNTRLQELEDRDKSELDRERSQRERAQTEAQQLQTRLVSLERGQWVRAAAAEANFIDPDDAVALVNLGEIESENDAESAVKRVARRKEHLIRKEQSQPPIGQVLSNGQPLQRPGEQPSISEDGQQLLGQIQEAQQRAGWTSTPLT